MAMTGTQRIRAMIEKKPFDRVGVSGWLHFPLADTEAEDFARAEIAFSDYCRWDFIKVMANPHLISDIFGAEIVFSKDPEQWMGDYKRYPIRNTEDARNLVERDASNPIIRRETEIIRKLKAHYEDKVPLVLTVFSPLMAFQEMTQCSVPGPTIEFVREHPAELHHALDVITRTLIALIDSQLEAGADGVFFANPFVTDILSDAEFEEFSRPYDLRILEHIKDSTWFNFMHVHGNRGLRFSRVLDYPVQGFNWENVAEGVPDDELTSVADLRKLTDKILITGLDRDYDFLPFNYDREALKARFRERLDTVLRQSGDKRIIFAPGCSLRLNVDHFAYSLLSEVVDEIGWVDK